MGAGKTTVGQKLAERLGWTFRDLDEVVEKQQGKSIGAIFADRGEEAFRTMETSALRELLERNDNAKGMIIALGGGAFVQPVNRLAIERAGALTILLEAPLEELKRRIGLDGKTRPLATSDQALALVFVARQEAYDMVRHRVQTLNKPVDQIATEIECILDAATKSEVVP
jgi:shikimate kinase